jgi:Uma2 family endonuclease
MGLPKEKEGLFTYGDYYRWDDGERWELIDGVAYNMSPAPTRKHQAILLNLSREIADITDRGSCETYIAPFDVRFTADDQTDTVVQPDISVFCEQEKLDERGAVGAPDLVVEILSPSTSHKDLSDKLRLYESRGVREYWIVNGEGPWVMVYRLGGDGREGRYGKPDYYRPGDGIKSDVLGAEIGVDQFLDSGSPGKERE